MQNLHILGVHNIAAVRDKIREEQMFRFDNFFKSRTESELNKRIQSLYKLLEKEREISANGFDPALLKDKTETKKERKNAKIKGKESELAGRNGADSGESI